MNFTELTALVSVLIALSLASERLVEIIKGLIPFLNQENPDAAMEKWRKIAIQILAAVAGIFTAWLASQITKSGIENNPSSIIALGLLASAGSPFWNSILEYLLKVKDIKEVEAEKRKELKNYEIAKTKELRDAEVAKAQLEVETAKAALNLPAGNNPVK